MDQGEVWTFKLNSGEEVVAKINEVHVDYLLLEEPLSVAPSPQGMGLIPSMFTSNPKSKVRLNTNSISLSSETEDNLKMKYLEATTGISVPSKQLILG